jgi:hypothetical protein
MSVASVAFCRTWGAWRTGGLRVLWVLWVLEFLGVSWESGAENGSLLMYQRERHIIVCALGRLASSLPHLLAEAEATPHLTRYVNATRRLKTTLGEILMPVLEPD